MSNSSLDFLNMIKNQGSSKVVQPSTKSAVKPKAPISSENNIGDHKSRITSIDDNINANQKNVPIVNDRTIIAVIDTETNWHNEVMSVGIAIANTMDFKCIDKKYYILTPECYIGGYFSSALHMRNLIEITGSRKQIMQEIRQYLDEQGIRKILAYNAKFDYSHLLELQDYEWYDIMRLAAYKQYNSAIPDHLPCCKTGRLKTDYGVEPITHLLTGDGRYSETHNALCDAVDELRIVELLGKSIEEYECGRIG